MSKLSGQVAIVTGGGTGVGRATVLQLAARGCRVVVNYSRSQSDAEATAAEAQRHGGAAVAVQADVADDAQARRLVSRAVDQFGRLDLLVNNAGTTRFIPFADLDAVTDDDWLRLYQVNVVGAFHCARAASKAMLAGQGGQIINVTSIAGIWAKGSSIPYTASKAALNNLTIALARALAPRIRVNAVAPGFIDTRWTRGGLGPQFDAAVQSAIDRSLLGKVLVPEDVAAAIVSLADGSELVTGQVLVVDAGSVIG